MKVRTLLKGALSLLGVGLLFLLFRHGASLTESGGWYALGFLMAFGGALPKETMAFCGIGIAVLVAHRLLWNAPVLLGTTLAHGAVMGVLAVVLYGLDMPAEDQIMKCMHCYWRGPSKNLRFRHCPHCGSDRVRKSGKTVVLQH